VWGTTTNTNLAYVLEQSIAGYISVSVTTANQALTYINGGSSIAADNQSVHASLALTTTTTADFAVYAPPASKQYTIYNTSSYVATIYNSTVIGNTTAAGTGVAIPAGKTMTVWSDGTNFALQNTAIPLSAVTGLGTGVATALAVNVGSAGAPVVNGGALGTPSSGTLTNCTFPTLNQNTTGSAGSLATTNWTVVESGGYIYFKYGGVNKMRLDSSGNLVVTGNVTAYGSI
jgi:hypothetical protein